MARVQEQVVNIRISIDGDSPPLRVGRGLPNEPQYREVLRGQCGGLLFVERASPSAPDQVVLHYQCEGSHDSGTDVDTTVLRIQTPSGSSAASRMMRLLAVAARSGVSIIDYNNGRMALEVVGEGGR